MPTDILTNPVLALALSALLLVYLVIAMIFPEKF
ncbi:MAG: K(+)-transporting ATPase subunit F [Terracidiphilus sp.]